MWRLWYLHLVSAQFLLNFRALKSTVRRYSTVIVPLVPSPTDPRQAEINAHQWESTCPSVWAEPMEIGTLGSEEGGQPRTPGILCESRKKAARTRTQIFFYLRPILMTECSFSLSIKKKKKIFQLIHSRQMLQDSPFHFLLSSLSLLPHYDTNNLISSYFHLSTDKCFWPLAYLLLTSILIRNDNSDKDTQLALRLHPLPSCQSQRLPEGPQWVRHYLGGVSVNVTTGGPTDK